MEKKKIYIISTIVCAILLLVLFLNTNFDKEKKAGSDITEKSHISTEKKDFEKKSDKLSENVEVSEQKAPTDNSTVLKTASVQINTGYETKKTDMHNDIPTNNLPVSAVAELAGLPENIQREVCNIAENTPVFMIQKNNNKVFVIAENVNNIRHGVDFIEISVPNGHQSVTTLGYNGKIKDSDNDKWEYDSATNLPLKHMKYDEDGDLEFTETWNYEESNPVKYEMKDSKDNVLSLRKEELKDGTDLRVEHLVYDKSGNTKVNITTSYEGADIKRFTYYNADKPQESGSVFCEYENGQRVKETVLNSELKVKNVYNVKYKDDSKESITVLDSKNREVLKYIH